MSITYTLTFRDQTSATPSAPPQLAVDSDGDATYCDNGVNKEVSSLTITYSGNSQNPTMIPVTGGAWIEVARVDCQRAGGETKQGGCTWKSNAGVLEISFVPPEPEADGAVHYWGFSSDTPAMKLAVKIKRQNINPT